MSNKILFLDATVRPDSRTQILAKHLLSKLDGEISHLKLCNEEYPVLDEIYLKFRNDSSEKMDFEDIVFDKAKQFKEADTIVVAAPFWDYSFPSWLKTYIENICVLNLTFKYNEENKPVSLCKANKLYYVTTVGGFCDSYEFGYGYIKTVCEKFFGIKDSKLFSADGLDIVGNDSNLALQKAKSEIDNFFN